MRKKALSPVIATVLLVSLAIVLAVLVFSFGRNFISNLSPRVDCEGIDFSAEFSEIDKLSVVNIGGKQMEGIVVKEKGTDLTIKEALVVAIAPGKTKEINLPNFGQKDSGKTFLIVPMVYAETPDRKLVTSCLDRYGREVELE